MFVLKTTYEQRVKKLQADYQALFKKNEELQSALDAMMETYNRAVDERQRAEKGAAQLTVIIDSQAQSIGRYRYALICAINLLNDITITPKTMAGGREKAERRERVRE